MISQPVLPPLILDAVQALAQNLLDSEQFKIYWQASQRLDANARSRALLDEFSQTQANLRNAQAGDAVSPAGLQALRDLQVQVQADLTIMDYVASQQDAINFLREINTEISQLLGLNFAALAQRSTC